MVATFLAGTIIAVSFVLFWHLGIVSLSVKILQQSNLVFGTLRSPDFSDLEKEKYLQRNILNFIILLLHLLALTLCATAGPYLIALLSPHLQGPQTDEIEARLTDPLTVIVLLALGWAAEKGLRMFKTKGAHLQNLNQAAPTEIPYSPTDQLIYRTAFYTSQVQVELSSLENLAFQKKLRRSGDQNPVFVAGLPRAGTTLVLELLSSLNEFASHIYQDLPFIFTPLGWDFLSQSFRRKGELKERAHGDGMMIAGNSPEAFEEMIWRAFWPNRYQSNSLPIWPPDKNPEFSEFFSNHMKKIVILRRPDTPEATRYLSKNNGNLARLEWILANIPTARIVVPFRGYLAHCGSLLHQHHHFLRMQADNSFARDYMEGIGHYDFGKNLKPIRFQNVNQPEKADLYNTIEPWLHYWRDAYSHIVTLENPRIHLLHYESFCENPKFELKKLGDFLNIQQPEKLLSGSSKIRSPNPLSDDLLPNVSAALLAECENVYRTLLAKANQAVFLDPKT